MMEDIAATGDPFYVRTLDATGVQGASFEARLLLPLKSLAYGVPPHCFTDYFQMSYSLAAKCCRLFDKTIRKVYQSEYLRLPTEKDLQGIVALHNQVHGVDGMFGSIDCMHTYWKNCPVAWQGSFEGKEKRPSIVLEAISDYHLWFWHASYGYAGTLNDKNILNLSPFLESLVNGKFAEREAASGAIPFRIGEDEFHQLYVLVDGIYPRYTRFVKGMKEPITPMEKTFTGWQESTRKDIERAFGVLQCKFQVMQRPLHQLDLKNIAAKVSTCMILHNMCVSDRVMDGDVRAVYDPSNNLEEQQRPEAIEVPPDRRDVQRRVDRGQQEDRDLARVGIRQADVDAQRLVLRRQEWNRLQDTNEHVRLHRALMILKHNGNNNNN
jgi:hypothetical protein